MRFLPYSLIAFRFLLSPVILVLGYNYGKEYREVIVLLLYLGLISDILDGIIARQQQVSSTAFRRMDSQTDMIFWLSAGFSAWFIRPDVISENKMVIYLLLSMEACCYLVSILKFRKEACTHAYLSKLWGLSLLAAFTDLLLNGHAGFLFILCLAIGIISHLDRIIITLLLPTWQHDVPSSYHAYLVRKGKRFKKFILFNS